MTDAYRNEYNALIKDRYQDALIWAKHYRNEGNADKVTECLKNAAYWRSRLIWKV